ncbi:MAG: nucleotide exchange factor GrpE [Opitutales bacterium]|nr:nucleotide exchange factor GrpE [Opitutales bacterium]
MADFTQNSENNKKNPEAPAEEKQAESPAQNTQEKCGEKCECKKEISELDALKDELEKAKAEAAKNYDSYLRAAANLDTFRRRVQRDMDDLRKFAIQPFVEELLPSIDNLELALSHARGNSDFKNMVSGIEMVLSQIKKVFETFGIAEIRPIGEDFDPNFHECVAQQPSEKYAENKVSEIMRTGYTLNGRLIRPASVVVSSGAKKE